MCWKQLFYFGLLAQLASKLQPLANQVGVYFIRPATLLAGADLT